MWNILSFSQSTNHLQDEDTTTNTTTADLAALLLTNTDIIIDSKELCLDTGSTGLFGRHAKVKHVTSVVHGNDEKTLGGVDKVHGSLADLLGRGRSEDGTGHRGI